ncbi:MAG: protein kinase [Planctomycetaceae bacterium]|nr:protein kinase [Planctomycetaceae bacterium]
MFSAAYRDALWSTYTYIFPPPLIPRFKIVDVLGKGAFGLVYLAHQYALDRHVALKEVTRQYRTSPEFAQRLQFEAQALANAKSNHVVHVYDVLEVGGRVFIAMEYVGKGVYDFAPTTLTGLILSADGSRYQTICSVLAKVASGIECAHEMGIVHRDLKPANILIDSHGQPKICDFGLARTISAESNRTGEYSRAGTPCFMAPEQIEGRTLVLATDVWAIGVILYFLATGRYPFGGQEQIRHAGPQPMDDNVPSALRNVCLKCLEKDPARRYSRGKELALALESAAARLQDVSAPVKGAMPARTSQPFNRRRLGLYSGGLLTLVILAFALPKIFAVVKAAPGAAGDNSVTTQEFAEKLEYPCTSIAFTADGKSGVSESGGAIVHVWDIARSRQSKEIFHGLMRPAPKHSGSLAISLEDRVAALGINVHTEHLDQLQLVNLGSSQKSHVELGASFSGPMKFTSDGKFLFLASEPNYLQQEFLAPILEVVRNEKPESGSQLVIYDMASRGKRTAPMKSPVGCLAAHPKQPQQALIGWENKPNLLFWDVEANSSLGETKTPHGCDAIEYAADGREIYAAFGIDDMIRVFSAQIGGAEVRSVSTKAFGRLKCVSFSPAGMAVTAHADGKVVLWDLSAKTHQSLDSSPELATALALSPDGRQALAAFKDGAVRLYQFGSR